MKTKSQIVHLSFRKIQAKREVKTGLLRDSQRIIVRYKLMGLVKLIKYTEKIRDQSHMRYVALLESHFTRSFIFC